MSRLARSNSARRLGVRPRPARLMKNSSIRRPDVTPRGLTRLEARTRAMIRAFFVNRPGGGAVDTVVTVWTHRRLVAAFLGPRRLTAGGS